MLSQFKWYRQLTGGMWYQVRFRHCQGADFIWVRQPSEETMHIEGTCIRIQRETIVKSEYHV